MKYTEEFSVNNFQFWAGAKDVANAFREAGRLKELGWMIEEAFCDEPPSATAINDFVWFSVPEMEDLEEKYGVKL